MVDIEQIERGVHNYAEHEIAPRANGLSKFAMYMILPSVDKVVENYAGKVKANGMFDDIMDANGNVDLETLKERAEVAMEHCNYIEMYGFRFNKDDIEMLYNYIRRA